MSILDEGRQIRNELARLRSYKRRRYSPSLKGRILDGHARAIASGEVFEANAAKLLGIRTWRIVAWRRDAARAEPAALALLEMIETLQAKAQAAEAAVARAEAEQQRAEERAAKERQARPKTGPTPQPRLPIIEQIFTLDGPDRAYPRCGGELRPLTGQFEESELIDLIEVRYELVRVKQQTYACRCGGCIDTAARPRACAPRQPILARACEQGRPRKVARAPAARAAVPHPRSPWVTDTSQTL